MSIRKYRHAPANAAGSWQRQRIRRFEHPGSIDDGVGLGFTIGDFLGDFLGENRAFEILTATPFSHDIHPFVGGISLGYRFQDARAPNCAVAPWPKRGGWICDEIPGRGQWTTSQMDLGISDRVRPILEAVRTFIGERVMPVDEAFLAEVDNGGRWTLSARQREIIDDLKSAAREQGLWNFWLTDSERGYGLSTVEYAYLAEETGRSHLAAEAFNCSAPDTGNMEVLERYGSAAQKAQWLEPLLNGEIRSAYAMTEPGVASSDATNISTSAVLDGGEWVINGEKTYISGAGDPRCKIMICMCKTGDDDSRHTQHSQILIPLDTPGVDIVRPMRVFAADDAPHGHMHLRLTDVRVPESNVILGPGRGFEIAQGRLGPGRVHHCMRAIGMAERALELMCRRSVSRTAFGKPLAKLGGNFDRIAEARMNIDMARLLTLKTAHVIDTGGVRAARTWISKIKATVPNITIGVIDDAIQMHGAAGLSQDFPLAGMYTAARTLRLADGPDEVHRMVVARDELGRYL